MKRKKVDSRRPLHLNLKLKNGMPNLRHVSLLRQFKVSAMKAKLKGLKIIHYSIQTNHLHLIVEAENNQNLANGLRSFLGRYGKSIRRFTFNRGFGKKIGAVFNGRYHLTEISSPRQMRNTLRYVTDFLRRDTLKI